MTDPIDMSTDGYSSLREEFRLAFDPCDAWGSVMGWFFGVADVLYHHDADLIPDTWRFGHGAGCDGNSLDDPDRDIQDGLDDGWWAPEDLVSFGTVLSRFSDMLRTNGGSY